LAADRVDWAPELGKVRTMAAEQMYEITGGCHCGNLRLELQWPAGAERMPARACGCSFCTKHGGIWTSHPAARLTLRIADPAKATRYRFGTGTADFHVCCACGAVPAVTCTLEGRTYAVVNVNCLDGVDQARLDHMAADFEGKAVADRLARRRARWIAEVAIDAGPD
jgi:hypothetical protein